jgi:hypothetical protein
MYRIYRVIKDIAAKQYIGRGFFIFAKDGNSKSEKNSLRYSST